MIPHQISSVKSYYDSNNCLTLSITIGRNNSIVRLDYSMKKLVDRGNSPSDRGNICHNHSVIAPDKSSIRKLQYASLIRRKLTLNNKRALLISEKAPLAKISKSVTGKFQSLPQHTTISMLASAPTSTSGLAGGC